MRVQEFPDCCGGAIVSQFGGTSRALGSIVRHTEEEINNQLNLVEDQSYGFVMVTINNEQEPFVAPVLKQRDYILVDKVDNPKHTNSEISIYYKAVNQ